MRSQFHIDMGTSENLNLNVAIAIMIKEYIHNYEAV